MLKITKKAANIMWMNQCREREKERERERDLQEKQTAY